MEMIRIRVRIWFNKPLLAIVFIFGYKVDKETYSIKCRVFKFMLRNWML